MIRCGLDYTTAIMRTDKAFLVYTNWQAWVDTTESNRLAKTRFKIRKTEIDRETVNGHPCVKCDVFASGGGRFISALLWEATDLNGFPVRMDWSKKGVNWSVVFLTIDHKPPKADLFEVPVGYKRYDDLGEFARAVCPEAVVGEKK